MCTVLKLFENSIWGHLFFSCDISRAYMKWNRRKKKQEKHLFVATVSEKYSQKQYHKFRSPLSPVSVICVTLEGDFVNENWNKYIHKPHIWDEPKANSFDEFEHFNFLLMVTWVIKHGSHFLIHTLIGTENIIFNYDHSVYNLFYRWRGWLPKRLSVTTPSHTSRDIHGFWKGREYSFPNIQRYIWKIRY